MKGILLFILAFGVALAQSISIRTTTIIDGRGRVLKNQQIVVEKGLIRSIQSAAGKATYDLSGLTVLPGFIDTHVHLGYFFDDAGRLAEHAGPQVEALNAAANAYATLMAGFTTVQSLGSAVDGPVRDLIARGLLPGPRVLTSLGSLNENSGTPDQIRDAVRKMKASGSDVIKLFATKSIREGGKQSMTFEQIQAACGEAKAVGLRAVVHAHASDGATAAVKAGCTSIEHGTFLDDATLELMAAHGVFFDPNFLVVHNYLDNKPKFLGIGNYTEEGFAYMQKAVPLLPAVLRRAAAHKLKVVFGTDAVAGAHGRNAEEFVYRVNDGGQHPLAALTSAASTAAESLGLDGLTGTLREGLQADLIALDGDPLRDITAVRRVVFVMKAGRVYRNR